MIRIPIDNFVFKSFSTNTIKLDVALKDLDDSMYILFVELPASESYFFVIESRQITRVCQVSGKLEFLGSKTLELITFELERVKSVLTLGKVSKPLESFYAMLLDSQPELTNINTEYFSFWRFAASIKQQGAYGVGFISNNEKSLWAIFEAGELSGGWMVKNGQSPTSLQVDAVLEEAVKTSGSFSFHRYEPPMYLDLKPTSVLAHTERFPNLVLPDSKERLLALRKIGEVGLEIGCVFDGRLMISEIAAMLRISEAEILKVAEFLYNENLLARN